MSILLNLFFAFGISSVASYWLYQLAISIITRNEEPSIGSIVYGYNAVIVIPLLTLVLISPIYKLMRETSTLGTILRILGALGLVVFTWWLFNFIKYAHTLYTIKTSF